MSLFIPIFYDNLTYLIFIFNSTPIYDINIKLVTVVHKIRLNILGSISALSALIRSWIQFAPVCRLQPALRHSFPCCYFSSTITQSMNLSCLIDITVPSNYTCLIQFYTLLILRCGSSKRGKKKKKNIWPTLTNKITM